MDQEAQIGMEEAEKIHKLVVLVGDQGADCYKRNLMKFSSFLLNHLNNTNAVNGQAIKSLLIKKLSAR
jgi:hypothetical protein